jgi:hypothetical protein
MLTSEERRFAFARRLEKFRCSRRLTDLFSVSGPAFDGQLAEMELPEPPVRVAGP